MTLDGSDVVSGGNLQRHHLLLEQHRSRTNRPQFEYRLPKSAFSFAAVVALIFLWVTLSLVEKQSGAEMRKEER